MVINKDARLAEYTSFGVGGPADNLIIVESAKELNETISKHSEEKLWILGFGTNVLISDKGLKGTTIITHGGKIEQNGNKLIIDSGVWWDNVVQLAISKELWGIELMSGIPGSLGGAVFININAYGQSLADRLEWIEVIDIKTKELKKLMAAEFEWGYKKSIFQNEKNLIIIKACLKLARESTCELTYQKALDVANELNLKTDTLESRRKIILEARHRAGSIFIPNQGYEKTVGSFFRNPIVSKEQAELVMGYDESGKTKEEIMSMNRVHGGSAYRVSAAHVLLTCGFSRGQTWGGVRLHPKNLLKIENFDSASAQDIYNVSQLIIKTAQEKLNIKLEAEAQILGEFE